MQIKNRKLKVNNKGITLIALVITIIILLMLAGITFMQLTDNGLFEKAIQAKEKSENAKILEEKNGIINFKAGSRPFQPGRRRCGRRDF